MSKSGKTIKDHLKAMEDAAAPIKDIREQAKGPDGLTQFGLDIIAAGKRNNIIRRQIAQFLDVPVETVHKLYVGNELSPVEEQVLGLIEKIFDRRMHGVHHTVFFTDLAAAFHSNPENQGQKDVNLISIVNKLVKMGKLIELEFVIPQADHKIKSMYFPAGTTAWKFVGLVLNSSDDED